MKIGGFDGFNNGDDDQNKGPEIPGFDLGNAGDFSFDDEDEKRKATREGDLVNIPDFAFGYGPGGGGGAGLSAEQKAENHAIRYPNTVSGGILGNGAGNGGSNPVAREVEQSDAAFAARQEDARLDLHHAQRESNADWMAKAVDFGEVGGVTMIDKLRDNPGKEWTHEGFAYSIDDRDQITARNVETGELWEAHAQDVQDNVEAAHAAQLDKRDQALADHQPAPAKEPITAEEYAERQANRSPDQQALFNRIAAASNREEITAETGFDRQQVEQGEAKPYGETVMFDRDQIFADLQLKQEMGEKAYVSHTFGEIAHGGLRIAGFELAGEKVTENHTDFANDYKHVMTWDVNNPVQPLSHEVSVVDRRTAEQIERDDLATEYREEYRETGLEVGKDVSAYGAEEETNLIRELRENREPIEFDGVTYSFKGGELVCVTADGSFNVHAADASEGILRERGQGEALDAMSEQERYDTVIASQVGPKEKARIDSIVEQAQAAGQGVTDTPKEAERLAFVQKEQAEAQGLGAHLVYYGGSEHNINLVDDLREKGHPVTHLGNGYSLEGDRLRVTDMDSEHRNSVTYDANAVSEAIDQAQAKIGAAEKVGAEVADFGIDQDMTIVNVLRTGVVVDHGGASYSFDRDASEVVRRANGQETRHDAYNVERGVHNERYDREQVTAETSYLAARNEQAQSQSQAPQQASSQQQQDKPLMVDFLRSNPGLSVNTPTGTASYDQQANEIVRFNRSTGQESRENADQARGRELAQREAQGQAPQTSADRSASQSQAQDQAKGQGGTYLNRIAADMAAERGNGPEAPDVARAKERDQEMSAANSQVQSKKQSMG
ncbi:hypothetical protein ELG97_37190 [Rhizobium leguminosarum]|uniref:hypothetical protein n=1 Tax=Rhizobium leguminosarum TaxID=384 RepID=UPI001030742E|nr:hypothetical protein [Rhizobium leguminosarum]TBE73867.1 hypothetical protein ELG97_37190 [Rhizobium leguminosarum]